MALDPTDTVYADIARAAAKAALLAIVPDLDEATFDQVTEPIFDAEWWKVAP